MGAYGGWYLPYQSEPIVASGDNTTDEEMGLGDDAAQDDDGIHPSQLRERSDGTTTLNEWLVVSSFS